MQSSGVHLLAENNSCNLSNIFINDVFASFRNFGSLNSLCLAKSMSLNKLLQEFFNVLLEF